MAERGSVPAVSSHRRDVTVRGSAEHGDAPRHTVSLGRTALGCVAMAPPNTSHRSDPAPSARSVPAWVRRWLPWAVVVVAVVATGMIAARRGEDLALLGAIDAGAVAALVALQGLYLVMQSGRFHVVLVRLADRGVGFWPWLRLFVVGRFLNLFVPQAGNVYRGVELKRRFDVRYTRFFAAFVNAPWVAMVLNFAFGAVLLGVLQSGASVAGLPVWLTLGAAALATAAAPFVITLLLPLVPQRVRWVAWLHGRLAEMLRVTLASLRDVGYVGRVVAWTAAAFAQAVVMLWVCFAALGVSVGLAEVVAFYVLLQLATYVAITPGNLGLQELAFAGLATGMGGGAVEGVLVSGLVRVTGVLALVALALPFGGVEALRVSRTQRLADARP
jgi:uncharacterized membrane protein YbhN (UPF0104 family)